MCSFFLVLLLWQNMAVPPTYADLGKSARDVFTKGYGECRRSREQWEAFHLLRELASL
jgi:hypothetical protein